MSCKFYKGEADEAEASDRARRREEPRPEKRRAGTEAGPFTLHMRTPVGYEAIHNDLLVHGVPKGAIDKHELVLRAVGAGTNTLPTEVGINPHHRTFGFALQQADRALVFSFDTFSSKSEVKRVSIVKQMPDGDIARVVSRHRASLANMQPLMLWLNPITFSLHEAALIWAENLWLNLRLACGKIWGSLKQALRFQKNNRR